MQKQPSSPCRLLFLVTAGLLLGIAPVSRAIYGEMPVKLVSTPALSSDGSEIVFSWRRDIWTASSDGGAIRRITNHAAMDVAPEFSPEGEQIAFSSDRSGSMQVYRVPGEGGGRPRYNVSVCM